MIRMPLSAIGGAGLALVLFWLLALLVAPPEEEFEMREMSPPIDVVEAPDMPSEPSEPAPALETLPEPPVLAEPPPAPADPAPLPDSELALPETEPEPEPEPEPQPEPTPVAPPQAEAEAPPDSAPVRSRESDADTEPRGEASEGPIDVGELLPINRVPPEYPRRAQRRRLEGYVELTFLVTPNGRVDTDSIRVVEARPGNVFDRAARQAVSQWRFEPSGRLRRARQRLEFQLR